MDVQLLACSQENGETSNMTKPTALDPLDTLLLAELEVVRNGEERLRRLYPKLQQQPQLQECFLQALAELQQRADRLDAILSPFDRCGAWAVADCQLPAA